MKNIKYIIAAGVLTLSGLCHAHGVNLDSLRKQVEDFKQKIQAENETKRTNLETYLTVQHQAFLNHKTEMSDLSHGNFGKRVGVENADLLSIIEATGFSKSELGNYKQNVETAIYRLSQQIGREDVRVFTSLTAGVRAQQNTIKILEGINEKLPSAPLDGFQENLALAQINESLADLAVLAFPKP